MNYSAEEVGSNQWYDTTSLKGLRIMLAPEIDKNEFPSPNVLKYFPKSSYEYFLS